MHASSPTTPAIHPHGWRELLLGTADDSEGKLPPAHRRRLETLARLAEKLNPALSIYHGVHWTRLDGDSAVFADIDFIIVAPTGRLLLIEQVAGFLDETPSGLTRRQAGRDVLMPAHLADNRVLFEGRLRRALGAAALPAIDVLLYCPDYTVRNEGSAGLPPERIVDASRRESLPEIITALLGDATETPPTRGKDHAAMTAPSAPLAMSAAPQHSAAEKLHRFLSNLLDLVPDANAMVGDAARLSTRLSGGLTEWARRLDFSPFRLRVLGTAGSGKTQLALAVLRDALAAGRRPLYVCYNRPLADHIAASLTERLEASPDSEGTMALITSYHQLADRVLQSGGHITDFSQPHAFSEIEAEFSRRVRAADPCIDPWKVDELIIDEGQDFHPQWAHTLLGLLKPEGRAWWLEDPRQNLYQRTPVRLSGWVELCADTNYRSPKLIADALQQLTGHVERVGSPIKGFPVDTLVYKDAAGLIEQTKRAIGIGIAAGFRRDMIAVLSCRGRQKSALSNLDRLGPYSLRAFTGRYDLLGQPIYTEGELLIDSVMRFKGRAAPCVVLTEIDFETLDAAARCRLFVGASRASLRLILVAKNTTANMLGETAP